MTTLNWSSLNPLKLNNSKVTLSWGTEKDEVRCARVCLQEGQSSVKLARRDLILIGYFSGDNQRRTYYDFEVSSLGKYVIIKKATNELQMDDETFEVFASLIPGLVYMMESLTPELYTSKSSDAKIFISDLFPIAIRCEDTPSFALDLEKVLDPRYNKNMDFTNKIEELWSYYDSQFVRKKWPLEKINEQQFKQRAQGQFVQGLLPIYKDNPRLLCSLCTLIRQYIDEYKNQKY